MSQREIELRFWDGKQKRFGYVHIGPYGISWPHKSWLKFLPQESGVNIEDVEAVCEWTGLKDRNGRKIFEGDLVKDNGPDRVYRVEYQAPEFVCEDDSDCQCISLRGFHDELEVLGNIHENPELLQREGKV